MEKPRTRDNPLRAGFQANMTKIAVIEENGYKFWDVRGPVRSKRLPRDSNFCFEFFYRLFSSASSKSFDCLIHFNASRQRLLFDGRFLFIGTYLQDADPDVDSKWLYQSQSKLHEAVFILVSPTVRLGVPLNEV